jgi:hypothetical protein
VEDLLSPEQLPTSKEKILLHGEELIFGFEN